MSDKEFPDLVDLAQQRATAAKDEEVAFGRKGAVDPLETKKLSDIRYYSDLAIDYAKAEDRSTKSKKEDWSVHVALNRIPYLKQYGLDEELIEAVKNSIREKHRHMKADKVASKIFGKPVKRRGSE